MSSALKWQRGNFNAATEKSQTEKYQQINVQVKVATHIQQHTNVHTEVQMRC